MAQDDIDKPGGGRVASKLSPARADKLNAIATDLANAHSDVHSAIEQTTNAVTADLATDQSAANLALHSAIGSIDNALIPHESAVTSAVAKQSDNIMNSLLNAESEVAQTGVSVPVMSDEMQRDLDDPTGAALVARLMGRDDYHVGSVGPARPDCPFPVKDGAGVVYCYTPPPGGAQTPPPGYYYVIPEPSPGEPPPLVPPPPLPIDVPAPAPPVVPPPPPNAPPPPPPPAEEPPHDCGCPAPVVNVSCPDVIVNIPPNNSQPPPTSPEPPPVPPVIVVEPGPEPEPEPEPELPMPPPPPPAEGPLPPAGPEPRAPVPLFSDQNVCSILGENFNKYVNLYRMPSEADGSQPSAISDILRTSVGLINAVGDGIFGAGARQDKSQALAQSYTIAGDWLGGYSQAITVFDLLDQRFLPYPETAFSLAFVIGAAHKAEGTSGMPLDYLTTPVQYLYKAANPQYILDQPELDNSLVRGLINEDQWQCYTKMHGNIPKLRYNYVQTMRPIPTPDQIAVLENRGGDVATLTEGWWQQSGLPDQNQRLPYRVLATYVPGPGDLVRFMVRDSFDDTVVKSGKLDKDFDVKFYGPGGRGAPGRAAEWAKANGMTEDQFRYFWYSHWNYPSNTALYDMLHRLRPDRPEVKQWDDVAAADGVPKALQRFGDRPLVLTLDDIRKIVEINDMAPGMVDPLLAISYHPINRTDGIQAYLSGAFTVDQLYHCFRDNGYDEATAKTMVDIQVTAAARRNNNLTGLWSIKKTINAYMDGIIDGVKADAFLVPLMPNPAERTRALQLADQEVVAGNNREWLRYERRRYIFGETDDRQCIEALEARGVTARRAADLNDTWRALRVGRFREPTAKMVLGWLAKGIINTSDCFTRLDRLGYKTEDINRMINQGIIDWGERIEGKIDKYEKKKEKITKSMKDMRKSTESELSAQAAVLQARITDYQNNLANVRKEMSDRAIPFDS